MAEFPVNTHRFDPYKNFKFRVVLDGRVIPGISKVSALKRTTEPVGWRSGAALSRLSMAPGKTLFEPITLERGVTHDTTFEDWANLVFNVQGDAAISLKNLRKDMVIDLQNLAGQTVLSYRVYRAWVSEYQALPDLDATDEGAVAIEQIVLQHDGWERDTAIVEPAET